jgi:hypothetical protein
MNARQAASWPRAIFSGQVSKINRPIARSAAPVKEFRQEDLAIPQRQAPAILAAAICQ